MFVIKPQISQAFQGLAAAGGTVLAVTGKPDDFPQLLWQHQGSHGFQSKLVKIWSLGALDSPANGKIAHRLPQSVVKKCQHM